MNNYLKNILGDVQGVIDQKTLEQSIILTRILGEQILNSPKLDEKIRKINSPLYGEYLLSVVEKKKTGLKESTIERSLMYIYGELVERDPGCKLSEINESFDQDVIDEIILEGHYHKAKLFQKIASMLFGDAFKKGYTNKHFFAKENIKIPKKQESTVVVIPPEHIKLILENL